jgi:3'(2'), 5'-bisphosphate nucleotidase
VVVASHNFLDAKTKGYIEDLRVKYPSLEFTSASSSLKFCRLAEGAADIYPRFGRTMEWDTAAGQAILQSAGGRVENPEGGEFVYFKNAIWENGNFVAFGD